MTGSQNINNIGEKIMGMPCNMWIYDENNQLVKGNSKIKGREDSIDILNINHNVILPFDSNIGKITSPRKHSPFAILKKIDSSSPILQKACCNGQVFNNANISLYTVTDGGDEQEYYRYELENVIVVGIAPLINTQSDQFHLENVAFSYQTIKWQYVDGNITTQDTWLVR
jgi:type VI secretion system secreted protein Hcp